MAHKTLIGGTAYEVSGGKTLIGGTAYEVGFGKMVTITIVNGNATNPDKAYISIDGQVYDGSTEHTITVPVGTIVKCYASNNVQLNGNLVGSTAQVTYEHEITTNTEFEIISNSYVGWVYITEK